MGSIAVVRMSALMMVSVGWAASVSAQGVPQRVESLERRVAELEAAFAPMNITVDCAAGDSVAAALSRGEGKSARLNITINGVCTEDVAILRDNVAIVGSNPGDGLQATSPASTVLVVTASRVFLSRLTLRGGSTGLSAGRAVVVGFDLRITGAAQTGATVQVGALRLFNSTIENGAVFGATARLGGDLDLRSSIVRNNGFHGVFGDGGSVQLSSSSIEDNHGSGVFAWKGSSIHLQGTSVRNSGRAGVVLHGGSTLQLDSGTVIADSAENGLSVDFGSTANLRGVTIENNGGSGVGALGGSVVQLSDQPGVFIRTNRGDGIRLDDTSVAGGFIAASSQIQITGNTRNGIFCAPPPAVAQITGSGTNFSLNASHAFGNGLKQIDCPGIVVP